MVVVHAPSRLHFGLLSLPPAGPEATFWPDLEGRSSVPARWFGGVGLMVQAPGVAVRLEPATTWHAEGPLADRAFTFARRFLATFSEESLSVATPQRILVETSAPEHLGLGTGTQLALAVAKALNQLLDLRIADVCELARRVGRGLRSAVGIHGFARGGLIVEGGKREPDAIAPLVARLDFPEEWPVLLVLPSWGKGLHGLMESQAFVDLAAQQNVKGVDSLCRLVLLGMLPALVERDLDAFGEALYDFNRRVGESFRTVQGGLYAHPRTAEVSVFLRQHGVRAVGQSSWGPAIFAMMGDQERADDLKRRVMKQFALAEGEILITGASNRGAL